MPMYLISLQALKTPKIKPNNKKKLRFNDIRVEDYWNQKISSKTTFNIVFVWEGGWVGVSEVKRLKLKTFFLKSLKLFFGR